MRRPASAKPRPHSHTRNENENGRNSKSADYDDFLGVLQILSGVFSFHVAFASSFCCRHGSTDLRSVVLPAWQRGPEPEHVQREEVKADVVVETTDSILGFFSGWFRTLEAHHHQG